VWLAYGKEGYKKFRNFIDDFVVPNMLKKSHFEVFDKKQVRLRGTGRYIMV
jgi:hypothetical protein